MSGKTIYTVSRPCGSGKTYRACNHIAYMHKQRGGMFIICQPTKALATQTTKMLEEAGGKNLHCIHGDCSEAIQRDVRAAMNKIAEHQHGALLITNNTFDRLPYERPDKERWDLILDEIPKLDSYYELLIPRNYRLLTDHVELGDHYGAHVYYVKLRDRKAAKKFIKNVNKAIDKIDEVYVDVINCLLAGDPCFVDDRGWTNRGAARHHPGQGGLHGI